VLDANGQSLAYVYGRETKAYGSAAHCEQHRQAANAIQQELVPARNDERTQRTHMADEKEFAKELNEFN
jgi:hypothetical protein